jgi:hypothetical protein
MGHACPCLARPFTRRASRGASSLAPPIEVPDVVLVPAAERIACPHARIAEAVGDRLTVLFDSGVRTGDDVFKAIALGARAVLVGRPYVYGLGLDGQPGVEHVIRCLLAEFDLTLALSGHATPTGVGPSDLVEDSA